MDEWNLEKQINIEIVKNANETLDILEINML